MSESPLSPWYDVVVHRHRLCPCIFTSACRLLFVLLDIPPLSHPSRSSSCFLSSHITENHDQHFSQSTQKARPIQRLQESKNPHCYILSKLKTHISFCHLVFINSMQCTFTCTHHTLLSSGGGVVGHLRFCHPLTALTRRPSHYVFLCCETRLKLQCLYMPHIHICYTQRWIRKSAFKCAVSLFLSPFCCCSSSFWWKWKFIPHAGCATKMFSLHCTFSVGVRWERSDGWSVNFCVSLSHTYILFGWIRKRVSEHYALKVGKYKESIFFDAHTYAVRLVLEWVENCIRPVRKCCLVKCAILFILYFAMRSCISCRIYNVVSRIHATHSRKPTCVSYNVSCVYASMRAPAHTENLKCILHKIFSIGASAQRRGER